MSDFLKNFSLDKAIDVVIETGAKLLTGGKQGSSVDTVLDAGMDVDTSTSDGFLGLVKTGAKHYVGMMDDEDAVEYFKTPDIEKFKARSRYRPTQSGLAGGPTRWSPRSIDYQEALRRRLQNQNFETNLEAKTSQYTVRPTKGRTRPVSPGTTTISRTITAPRIKTGD
tara:strand:- start:1360 stop:1863 length:504 start_codon:yes stop_codon:yes gene_type:complete